MTKRLFCFSIYSRTGVIDDYVLYYIKALTECGDVIVCADNANYQDSIEKIQAISDKILHVEAERHGEYDFGSYKRCIAYAKTANILNKYDYVYICNDSVIGPLQDLNSILTTLEASNSDIITMYEYLTKGLQGPQSWFVGFSKNSQPTFFSFIKKVKKEEHKDDVVLKYEHGLGVTVKDYSVSALVSIDGLENFFDPETFFAEYPNYPFLKKRALLHTNKLTSEEFIDKYILNKELAANIKSLLPGIKEHEKTLTPKVRQMYADKLTRHMYRFCFVIPPIDPKKKKEQQYF